MTFYRKPAVHVKRSPEFPRCRQNSFQHHQSRLLFAKKAVCDELPAASAKMLSNCFALLRPASAGFNSNERSESDAARLRRAEKAKPASAIGNEKSEITIASDIV
jgi:hypothetical protein